MPRQAIVLLLLLLLSQRTLAFLIPHNTAATTRRSTEHVQRRRDAFSQRLATEDVISMLASTDAILQQSSPTFVQHHLLPAQMLVSELFAIPFLGQKETVHTDPEIAGFGKSIPPGYELEPLRKVMREQAALGFPPSPTPLDASKVTPMMTLPGSHFGPTLLGPHAPEVVSPETMMQGGLIWSTNMIHVFDKLPVAAFVYCLIEFLLLRPGIDRYQEDVQDDPLRAATDTAAVMAVRLVLMSMVAAATTALFYGT